jgi:hypothetical protein
MILSKICFVRTVIGRQGSIFSRGGSTSSHSTLGLTNGTGNMRPRSRGICTPALARCDPEDFTIHADVDPRSCTLCRKQRHRAPLFHSSSA